MRQFLVSPSTLTLLERVAAAIRGELGAEIEAYPGARSPDGADPINRGFRAVVRSLLEDEPVAEDDRAALLSLVLRGLAEGRLRLEGWDDDQIQGLIAEEPGSPDDWLAFLILSDREQLEPLLDPREPERR